MGEAKISIRQLCVALLFDDVLCEFTLGRFKVGWYAVLLVAASLTLSISTAAQDEVDAGQPPESEAAPSEEVPSRDAERDRKLETELQQIRDRLDTLEIQSLQETVDVEKDKFLVVYGFFDIAFFKYFTEKDSQFRDLITNHPSFTMQNLNLYFHSKMTNNLSAIAELRFTFAPHGQETSFTVPEMAGVEYERTDMTYQDSYSGEEFTLGGVGIERLHVTWRPFDFFGVIAGRYLTPYGIWNIDHGSPVLIPARQPQMQIEKRMPLAQTGLQIFGRLFVIPEVYFDYALTVSNGRGPMDAIVDLDDNKGLGLRLRVTYEGKDFSISGGGYSYLGDYTDVSKQMLSTDPMLVDEVPFLKYREWVNSADLLIQFFGVRLQAEWLRGLTYYKDNLRPRRSSLYGGEYQANYAVNTFYVLLAYRLPLDRWLGDMKLTPFAMFEYHDRNDTSEDALSHIWNGGLNFMLTPFVVLKIQYSYKHSIYRKHSDFGVMSLQLAVSF